MSLFMNYYRRIACMVAAGISVLDKDGNAFACSLSILDKDGNAFTVTNSVLDKDGNAFTVI